MSSCMPIATIGRRHSSSRFPSSASNRGRKFARIVRPERSQNTALTLPVQLASFDTFSPMIVNRLTATLAALFVAAAPLHAQRGDKGHTNQPLRVAREKIPPAPALTPEQ